MPSPPGNGGPPVLTPSGHGSVAWTAVGVYFGLAVLQVFVGFWGFNNAYAEMDPNGQAINGTVMAVLFISPSLIALGLVIWMSIAMVRAKGRAANPDPAAPDPAAPDLPPPPPPGNRTRTGVLIGSAAFLITCAGPCFGPSLVQFTSPGTPEPIQTAIPGPLPTDTDLPAEPGPPGVTFTAVP